MKESAIAIIAARGGDKRIPKKNQKDFLGRPIICYSIEAALSSELFDVVIVSTDNEEIAGIAREAGAEVSFVRSQKISNDFVTTHEVLSEVLSEYEKKGRTFEYMAYVCPAAPFVTAEKLRNAFHILKEQDASGVMPVVRFSFPPQRGMAVRDGRLVYCYPENIMKRSQDLEAVYHDCGQFCFYRIKEYLTCNGDPKERYFPVVMPETQVQDIDNPEDWEIAELKYKRMIGLL